MNFFVSVVVVRVNNFCVHFLDFLANGFLKENSITTWKVKQEPHSVGFLAVVNFFTFIAHASLVYIKIGIIQSE